MLDDSVKKLGIKGKDPCTGSSIMEPEPRSSEVRSGPTVSSQHTETHSWKGRDPE